MERRAAQRLHAIEVHLGVVHRACQGSPAMLEPVATQEKKEHKLKKLKKHAPPRLPVTLLPEVAQALAANRPVVALESTIISHGTDYPAYLYFYYYIFNVIMVRSFPVLN